MRTANPALNEKTFAQFGRAPVAAGAPAETMTIMGTVHRTAILTVILLLAASWTWSLYFTGGNPSATIPYMAIGGIGGFIVAMVTVFKPTAAPWSAPVYAALEGLLLGGLSAFFEAMYPGIVIQAVQLTFGTLVGLLLAYRSGMIKATENFKLGVVAATGGIFLVYMASFVMSLFGMPMAFLHSSGPLGIGISLVIVVVAALNLVLDFDFIENGAERGAPKFMEWYAAFGLMVTLIWLYIEMLRLLSKLRSR